MSCSNQWRVAPKRVKGDPNTRFLDKEPRSWSRAAFVYDGVALSARALLDNPVFEDAATSQEAAEILQEFIKLKTNNNEE